MALMWLLAVLMVPSSQGEQCCRAFQNATELREAVRAWDNQLADPSDTWQLRL